MKNTIEINHLDYYFSNQQILNDVSINVPTQSIYGFIGHNGAGKTTTIKLILGLLKTKSYNIKVFGNDIQTNRIEILRKVGSLVEQPAIYAHLTGYENLYNRCILLGLSKKEIERAATITKIDDY